MTKEQINTITLGLRIITYILIAIFISNLECLGSFTQGIFYILVLVLLVKEAIIYKRGGDKKWKLIN